MYGFAETYHNLRKSNNIYILNFQESGFSFTYQLGLYHDWHMVH